LNKQTQQAIAYAQNALSFIFLNPTINDSIQDIYLYGSAARGELTKDSDIDIFINCHEEKEKLLQNITKSALSKFYTSKDFDKWKLFKFNYLISFQTGNLTTWHLKTSILADGILLYSKKIQTTNIQRKILFTYTLPKNKNKYLHFSRIMFGRKEPGYKDKGILEQIEGRKISTNAIIVPKENQQKITEIMNKEKINYSFIEIGVFE